MIKLLQKILAILILVPLIVMVSPILLLYAALILTWELYLKIKIELRWPSNKFILFTYSESENWAQYIEENILPKISEHAVIINRTKQQDWKKEYGLERRALDSIAGHGINPVALIFRNGYRTKTIAFYEAFRDMKHGKESAINQKCQELFAYVPENP